MLCHSNPYLLTLEQKQKLWTENCIRDATYFLSWLPFHFIFLDAGEDSSLLGLLVLGPKGDHHGEVWLHAAARMAPVVGDHGVGPPSVSVHIPRSHVPAARAQLLLNEAEVIDHNKILKCLCWNFEYIIELETKVAKYDAKFHNHGEGSFSVIVKPLINLRFKLYNQMCSWKNLRGD
mgnify:CR=1 FL=1|jgi:hypothetical protein